MGLGLVWLRLAEAGWIYALYCIAAYLPRWGYAISQIYTAYIVRLPFNAIPQLAEVSVNNRLYPLPYTIWWDDVQQSRAELSCWNGNKIYTDLLSLPRFVRHSSGYPRDSTLRHRTLPRLRLRQSPQLNWTQLTYYACLHMFYALTGAMCTVMLRHLQHYLGKHCSVVQWEKLSRE